jgi:ATP-dependent helicase HrpA
MVDPATQFAFYDARLPASVVDWRSFEQWRGDAEKKDRRLLYMRPEDLMARSLSEAEGGQFPEKIETNGIELPLKYRFDPGHVADGVTATVHLADLHAIDADRLDWLVPGLIEEKVTDLIRTLPKKLRTAFVPVPEFAHRAVVKLPYAKGNLSERVARYLTDDRGIEVRAGDFRPDDLGDYLKLNLRVVDEHDTPVAYGRDVRELRKRLKVQARSKLANLPDSPWHRDGLVAWTIDDLPERVEIKLKGRGVQGFPALIDRGEIVNLRLLETMEAARVAHRRGVRRLLLLDYGPQIKHLLADKKELKKADLFYRPLGNAGKLRGHLVEAVGDTLFLGDDPGGIRTKAQFEERLNAAWAKVGDMAGRVATVAGAVLERRHKTQLALDAAADAPELLRPSIDEMREQLAHLVPADFLLATPPKYVGRIPRYLSAIETRLAKLLDAGLAKDSRAATAVFPFWKAWLDRLADVDAGPPSGGWIEFRWLLEEYRVSLFAQQLRTAEKVSDKVLRDRLAALQ